MENGVLNIALTKGRLEKEAASLFERAGYDCSELRDKGRKLILPIKSSDGRSDCAAVLAKAFDVITYVEHGICDIGITGKDIIMEAPGNFFELSDLGFGKCRFAVAGKKGHDFYGGYNAKTIATKYPAVARSFFEKKGMDVEIIKLEGSVELAPLLGLAGAIVDIVETGSTLKENGLEIYEEICQVSARLIVNKVSLKMKRKEIDDFMSKLGVG